MLAFAWQGVRIGMQAVWVVAIARALGPAGYGEFAGIAGLAAVLGAFSGLGLGLLMYQEVARDPATFARRWRQSVVLVLVTGVAFAATFPWISNVSLGQSAPVILLLIAVSEVVCTPVVTTAAFAFSAHDRMGWASFLPAALSAARAIAAIGFLFFSPQPDLLGYAKLHVVAGFLGAALALIAVRRKLRPAHARFQLSGADVGHGVGFSAMWASSAALGSIDKAMVLRFAGGEIAGHYASAYRFATLLALPVESMVMAALPRLFRRGADRDAHPNLVPRLLILASLYGGVAGVLLWAGSGLLPWLLGEQFRPAVSAVRWLALFVPIYSLRVLATSLMLAAGDKGLRVAVESGGVVAILVSGYLWIPRFGLDGAVMMIVASELLVAMVAWALLWRRAP